MNRYWIALCRSTLALLSGTIPALALLGAPAAAGRAAPAPAIAVLDRASLPARAPLGDRPDALRFEANRGQAGRGVLFLARARDLRVALAATGATLTPSAPGPAAGAVPVRMALVGARPARVVGIDRLPGTLNYLIGPDRRAWRTGIAAYAGVRYAGVYPGVDLVFRGDRGRLEYDFALEPGADPARIRLAFGGVRARAIDAAGDLVLRTATWTLRQGRPAIYQRAGGARRPVAGGWRLLPGGQAGFRLGAYDHRAPLVIDPLVIYAGAFGAHGGGADEANGVAVDAAGAAYVAGTTQSGLAHKAIFVAKYDPSGQRPLYTTLLGGGCDAQAGAIATDAAGAAYVTGLYTSKDANGICDVVQAVVAKLGPTGAPLYNVRFGGHQDFQAKDWGNGIAVDGRGDAYVAGETDNDPQFPATPGSVRSAPNAVGVDGFVLKVDPAGKLVYATYLGGSDLDHATAIAVDRQGDAYVTGQTASRDFPVTAGAYQAGQRKAGDLGDAFVAELNPAGSALLYATRLGGSAAEGGTAIAVDGQGRAYVTGATDSPDFPTTPNAYSPLCGGDGHCGLSAADQAGCASGTTDTCATYDDAFVAEIDPALRGRASLVYATYLGGTLVDGGAAIVVDGARRVYVAGATDSRDFPVVAATQPARGGANNPLGLNQDAFVAALDLARPGPAALLFSTYLGGSGDDAAAGIAAGRAGTVYVAGTTRSADFPARGRPAGGSDAFLVKLDTITVSKAMLPAIDAVGVYHRAGGKWAAASLIHRSEQTLLAVFYRPPQAGGAVTGRVTLTYHGGSSQVFPLVPYNDAGGDKVLGVAISWLPHGDNLGRVHAAFVVAGIGAQATRSLDFTIAP